MRDAHGTFKNYFDSYRVRWEGIDTHGGSMPRMEGVEIVAPQATSFTVSRTWLEHVRETFREAGDEVQVSFIDGVIGPAELPRETVLEVIQAAMGMDDPNEVVGALNAHGYVIIDAGGPR